jgi:hypothetical protein
MIVMDLIRTCILNGTNSNSSGSSSSLSNKHSGLLSSLVSQFRNTRLPESTCRSFKHRIESRSMEPSNVSPSTAAPDQIRIGSSRTLGLYPGGNALQQSHSTGRREPSRMAALLWRKCYGSRRQAGWLLHHDITNNCDPNDDFEMMASKRNCPPGSY